MSDIQRIPDSYQVEPDCLQNKNILITGAGDGIGRQMALSFAEHGAQIILLSKTQSKIETVYDEIVKAGHTEPALCPFDLACEDYESYKQIHDVMEKEFGHLDGLLHNASILGERRSIASHKPQSWLDTMQVNVNAVFLLTKALLPLLHKSSSASILFTSSSVGRKGRAHWGGYAVSKFATEGLMQTLADEFDGVANIRSNAINPGATRTTMRQNAYPAENPDSVKSPLELVRPYLYLFSNASQHVNGETFDV